MLISVEAAPEAGIRLIREIPDGDLLQIEGQNGIGKTLLARLLQLCTGIQPFVGLEASWSTLREHLKDVTIKVSGLADGDQLTFFLTPDTWPLKPDLQFADERFGRVDHNGAPIRWSEVPRILQVNRIGGDQTLGESLAMRLARDRAVLDRFSLLQTEKRKDWSSLLEDLIRITAPASDADLEKSRETLSFARDAEQEHKDALDAVAQRVTNLRSLLDLMTRFKQIESSAPSLEKKIAELLSIEEAEKKKAEELEAEIREAFTAAKISEPTVEGLTQMSQLRQRRRTRREKRSRDVRELSAAIGVDTPVDLDAVHELLREFERQEAELQESRKRVDRIGLMEDLAFELERDLTHGIEWDLSNSRLLWDPPIELTVSQTLEALRRNQSDLNVGQPRRNDIIDQIAAIQHRIEIAAKLPAAVRLLEVAESDLAETEQQIEAQLRTWKRDTSTYRELEQRRSDAEDRASDASESLHELRLELAKLLDDGSAEDIRSRAEQLAQASDLTTLMNSGADNLASALSATQDLHESTATGHREAVLNYAAEKQNLDRAEQAIILTAEALRDVDRFGWLVEHSVPLPDPTADPAEILTELRRIASAAQHIRRLLTDSLNQMQAAQSAISQVEQRLRRNAQANSTGGAAFDLTPSVVSHYEREFSSELSRPDISAALFDSSPTVTVDLSEMTTSWIEPGGTERTRPLEAFSSGERAFAYTRVQIDRLAETKALNRVIILDEFGSFIAKQRFDQLQRFLRTHALQTAADKIIVILPARTDLDPDDPDLIRTYAGYSARRIR